VLFLFVVMMLDINFVALRQGFLQYLPIGAVIALVLAVELILVGAGWSLSGEGQATAVDPTPAAAQISNTRALGQLLYTKYIYLFQAAGLVLLVAMIGAIVLTHRRRPGVRRQRIAAQVARRREDSVEVKKVSSGSGA